MILSSPLRLLAAFCLAALLAVALAAPARAQQEGLLQLDGDLHRFLLDQQTAGLLPEAHLSHRPLSAYDAQRYLDSLATRSAALTTTDRQRLAQFRGNAPGPGAAFVRARLPALYRNGTALFSVAADDYGLEVEPLLTFSYGRAQQTERADREATVPVWQNTRGIRIGGHVGKHIFFETRLEENQRRDVRVEYAKKTTPRITRASLVDGTTYDYLKAMGVVGFRSEHFEVRLGRDRNHWGPGRSSLVLSNFAPVYDQLQIRTSFWRLQYTNLFTEMEDLTPPGVTAGDQPLPRKYGAFHRLEINLPARVQLGLFESVIFTPDTTGGVRTRNDLDLSYLNPIIFYRAVERDRGSPDNVLLGADASWVAVPGLKLYTQFMLDELVVGEIGNGSWVNKWGWVAGAHLVNLPPGGLSLRVEYARLRPYLYTHRTGTSSYTHYNDLLGHPAGPNAQDFSVFADYQLTPRIQGALALAYTQRGRGTDSTNVGADPLRSYDTRASDDATLLQGIRQNELLVEARASFALLPSLYLEGALRVQSTDDAEQGLDRYVAPFVSLRWGAPFRSVRY